MWEEQKSWQHVESHRAEAYEIMKYAKIRVDLTIFRE